MIESFYRRVWRWHFWAGLLACPVLLVLAATGGLYVFREEIEDAWYADTTFVTPQGSARPASESLTAVRAAYPDRTVARIVLPADPVRATTMLVNQPPRADGVDPGPSDLVSVDPYRAVVIGERSNRSPFFGPVLDIHRRLFAGTPGRWVVEVTTSWTLVLLVTGLWLWIPKTWRRARGVWFPRVGGSTYAVLRDWHTVGGLYLLPFMALIAFTGLIYGVGALQLWNATTGGAVSLPRSYLGSPPSVVPSVANPVTVSVDVAVAEARLRWPDRPLTVQLPRTPTEAYIVTARGGHGPTSVGVVGVDRYSGTLLTENRYEELPWYARVRLWALPVHQGSVYGIASKIVALPACLALVGLAISGAWMWLARRLVGRSGFPKASGAAVPKAVVPLILVLGLVFPTVGATLIVVLVGEWLFERIDRRLPFRSRTVPSLPSIIEGSSS